MTNPTTEPPTTTRRLVIIDGHAQAFRSFYATAPSTGPDGLPNNALLGFASMLSRIARGQDPSEHAAYGAEPDLVAVVFDSLTDAPRNTFRSAIYPAYKAHRNPRPEALTRQIPYLPELAQAFGIQTFHDPDFEADDLIATLVAGAEAAGLETSIHSGDKDLMQLVSARTTVLDTMRGRRYTPEAVVERFGVEPRRIADWLALVGDASDNVPGVPGLGPKAATRVIRDAGSLHEAIAHPERLGRAHAVKLLAHREQALLSFELTRLRSDVALASGPDMPWQLTVSQPERNRLAALLRQLGLPLWLMPPAPAAGTAAPLRPTPRPATTPVASTPAASVAPAVSRASEPAPVPPCDHATLAPATVATPPISEVQQPSRSADGTEPQSMTSPPPAAAPGASASATNTRKRSTTPATEPPRPIQGSLWDD
jgi:DNA polymerase-1